MDRQPALPTDVLIVEDDLLIALDLEATVLNIGVARVRAASSVAAALRAIAERAPDFAFLNIDLGPERSFVVAERLRELEIAFVFVSGYGYDVGIPERLSDARRLDKPYSIDEIVDALRSAARK